MKKIILAALLTAVMVLTAIGCGKASGENVTVKLPTHANEKQTVKVKLGTYKGIALKGVTDEEFEANLAEVLQARATDEEVDGPAENGDTVNINYSGFRDGVAFEGGTDDSEEGTNLTLGSGRFIDGFEAGLVGAVKGQELDLNLTFPDPYPNNPDLAGQPVVFKVKVNTVLRTKVPELDDAFATELGFGTVDNLKKALRDDLDKVTYQEQIGATLTENCVVDNIPQTEIDDATSEFYNSVVNYAQSMANAYGMQMEMVLYYLYQCQSLEEFATYAGEYTQKKITYQYIIEAIYKNENLSYTEEEYNKRAMDYATSYGYETYEDFEADYGKDLIEDAIKMDIVVEFVIENAQKF